jgi:hypothetical protein
VKYLVTVLSFFFVSQSFAGAYSLECKSKDKTFKLSLGHIEVAQPEGDSLMGIYYADSSAELMGYEIEDFLKDERDKVVVDKPSTVNNRDNSVVVISKRNIRDECGNSGEERKFKALYRVLNMQGLEIKAPTELVCLYRGTIGHCK